MEQHREDPEGGRWLPGRASLESQGVDEAGEEERPPSDLGNPISVSLNFLICKRTTYLPITQGCWGDSVVPQHLSPLLNRGRMQRILPLWSRGHLTATSPAPGPSLIQHYCPTGATRSQSPDNPRSPSPG